MWDIFIVFAILFSWLLFFVACEDLEEHLTRITKALEKQNK